jgi:hypothetical protein
MVNNAMAPNEPAMTFILSWLTTTGQPG